MTRDLPRPRFPRPRWWISLVLRIPESATSLERRAFAIDDARVQAHLQRVASTFALGFNASIRQSGVRELASFLDTLDPAVRGFAFEGSAMGLTMLDRLLPGRRDRFLALLDGPGRLHDYMLHVGAGWALARLRRWEESILAPLDPLLRWLAFDGYGFHEGFFRWRVTVGDGRVPRRLEGYARRAFDQGVGRSLWFSMGADPERIARSIARLDENRRGDLWSGVGLACAYAGGRDRATLERLREEAGPDRASLAQGAAFAAEARHRAGFVPDHTEEAGQVLCNRDVLALAGLCRATRPRTAGSEAIPAYESWRNQVQAALIL